MPTSSQFEDVADDLQDLIGDLEELAQPLENRMGAHVLEGGELTDSVYESLKSTRVTALSLSAIVDEYRNEVVRRLEEARAAAKAQEDYGEDLEDHRYATSQWDQYQSGDWPFKVFPPEEPGPPPTPPPAPPEYVDL